MSHIQKGSGGQPCRQQRRRRQSKRFPVEEGSGLAEGDVEKSVHCDDVDKLCRGCSCCGVEMLGQLGGTMMIPSIL